MGLLILAMVCIVLGIFYLRLRMELRFLYKQLEEIERGSHMKLAVNSRQRQMLALCRKLNEILASRDHAHIQYERGEKRLKQDITSLAHDIRTPLTGASGYVQLAQECDDLEKKEHYLQAAGVRLSQLEDMLEEMFLYTKLAGEDFTLSIGKVQVLPLLSECLLGLYAKFEEMGISPEVAFESEGLCVRADEEALRRVFLNLLQNALIHGVGTITITQKGSSLTFENPVPESSYPDPEQLFDRFYKVDPARRKGSSGLGLFIVKELMERMEGEVWAEFEGGVLRIGLKFQE